jgi:hypothetical protein
MMGRTIYAGMRFDENLAKQISEEYPSWHISETCGCRYDLHKVRKYLVRCGKEAVIMPQMKYSDEVEAVLKRLTSKENGCV